MFEMQIAELRPRTERRRHDGDAAVREKTQEIEPLSEEKIERLRTRRFQTMGKIAGQTSGIR
jgi:hypothetical protein